MARAINLATKEVCLHRSTPDRGICQLTSQVSGMTWTPDPRLYQNTVTNFGVYSRMTSAVPSYRYDRFLVILLTELNLSY